MAFIVYIIDDSFVTLKDYEENNISKYHFVTGITVQTDEGALLVKAQLLMASLDLPARAIVANMKQFNGKFGCSVCLDEGKSRPGQAMLRYFPFKELVQLRTHTSMVTDARKAALEGNEVEFLYHYIRSLLVLF